MLREAIRGRNDKLRASFIIPSINQTTLLRDCIESLIAFHPDRSQYEILVVDDCSRPDVVQWTKDYCTSRDVRLILREKNGGFPTAANQGMVSSFGKLLLLVNNDIVFRTEVLQKFEEGFKRDDKIAIIGARLYYPDGRVQHGGVKRVPNSHQFIHEGVGLNKDDPRVNVPGYKVSVTGALIAIDGAKFGRLGLLNDDYFISCDDAEYCVNCWSRGYRVFYDPRIEAIHYEGYTRGNTDQSKKEKGAQWIEPERKAHALFYQHMSHYNFEVIEKEISKLNGVPEVQATVRAPSEDKEHKTPTVIRGGRKLIIKRQGALGDVIMTTPIARHLRRIYPDADIMVATDVPAVYRNNPNVTGTIPHNAIPANVDAVYDLDLCYERMPKSHIVDAYSLKVFNHTKIQKDLDIFPDSDDHLKVQKLVDENKIVPNRMVVLHMAVTWRNRTWPIDKWMQVILHLSQTYQVALVGTPGDFRVGAPMNNVFEFHGKLSIQQLKVLISMASCFLGNDSGLMHVAGSTNVPIAGIFTSAKPEFRLPFRNGVLGERCVSIVPSIDCRGCLHDETPPVTFCDCRRNDFICLTQITPSMVLKSVEAIMAQRIT